MFFNASRRWMKMDVEIQPLTRDFEYLADLYRRIRVKFRDTMDQDIGTIYDAFFTEFSLDSVFSDPELVLEARVDDKVVGTLGAEIISCRFKGEPMKAAVIGFLGIDPDYWDEGAEILDRLATELFSRIAKREADFIYCLPIASKNTPEIEFLKEHHKMVVMNKNVEGKIKLLGKEGVDMLRDARNLNVVEAQAARIVARLKNHELAGGTIREATPEDYPTIVKLLNDYTKRLDLARTWTLEEFKKYTNEMITLEKRDYKSREQFKDTPFGYHVWVWDDDGEIKATLSSEISEIYMVSGYIPMAFFQNLAFSEDIESNPEGMELKKGFVATILRSLHKTVGIVNALLPQYAEKVLGKLGFMGEQRTTRLLVKSLSIKGNKIIESKKLRKFYLMFVDFSV